MKSVAGSFGLIFLIVALMEQLFFRGDNCTVFLLCYHPAQFGFHVVLVGVSIVAAVRSDWAHALLRTAGIALLIAATLSYLPASALWLGDRLGQPPTPLIAIIYIVTGLVAVYTGFVSETKPETKTIRRR